MGDNGKETEIAVLTDGDYCGEQALLHDAVRGATVRAVAPTKALILNQEAFKSIANEGNVHFVTRDAKRNAISAELMESMKGQDTEPAGDRTKSAAMKKWLLEAVSDNILFTHLDEPQRAIVVDQMYKQEIKKNEFLIKQG